MLPSPIVRNAEEMIIEEIAELVWLLLPYLVFMFWFLDFRSDDVFNLKCGSCGDGSERRCMLFSFSFRAFCMSLVLATT